MKKLLMLLVMVIWLMPIPASAMSFNSDWGVDLSGFYSYTINGENNGQNVSAGPYIGPFFAAMSDDGKHKMEFIAVAATGQIAYSSGTSVAGAVFLGPVGYNGFMPLIGYNLQNNGIQIGFHGTIDSLQSRGKDLVTAITGLFGF